MKKRNPAKMIVAVIFFLLTLGVAGYCAAYVFFIAPNLALRPYGDATALQLFIHSLTFRFDLLVAPQVYYMYGVCGGLYFGAVLFLIALGFVFGRRSARFFFLPLGGLIGIAAGGYMILAYTVEATILILAFGIASASLGFLCMLLALFFPKGPAKEAAAVAPSATKEPVQEETTEEVEPTIIVVEPAPEETKKEVEPAPEPKVEPAAAPEPEPENAEEEKPAQDEPIEAENNAEPEPIEEVVPVTEEKSKKVTGKYEVFPEAGFYKYRLKANNGEILLVSNPYRTVESANAGIDTLKKNIPFGRHKVVTDKKGFGQFRISTANDARLVAAGEIYPTAAGAEKALNSVLKFFDSEKVVQLDDIPESEHREWPLEVSKLEPKNNGKVTIIMTEEGKFQATLFANNGELLFSTSTYSSRAALTKALENMTARLVEGKGITISKDKQDRYQFRLYSDNGMVLLMGETYPTFDAASSAAESARNFIKDAKAN